MPGMENPNWLAEVWVGRIWQNLAGDAPQRRHTAPRITTTQLNGTPTTYPSTPIHAAPAPVQTPTHTSIIPQQPT